MFQTNLWKGENIPVNDGTFYILKSIVSLRENTIHGRIVNTVCEPMTFQAGEYGFFKSLMGDGIWHVIITSPVTDVEIQEDENGIVLHTINSVYVFQKLNQDEMPIMADAEIEKGEKHESNHG